MSNDKTLAVGERLNIRKDWRPCRPEMNYSFILRLNMGFYNKTGEGSRRAFLNSLGIVWDDGINLLWPSKTLGAWDATEAHVVAQLLRHDVEEYDTALLFGRRVCDAFDVKFHVLERQGIYVPLPHPSGRNYMWNDCAMLMLIRRHFRPRAIDVIAKVAKAQLEEKYGSVADAITEKCKSRKDNLNKFKL